MNSLSICITTWNSAPFLRLCLAAIKQNTVIPYEVMIYDNGSMDETKEVVEACGIGALTYMLGTNKGINQGWNRCVEKAQYDHCITLHTDMCVLSEWDLALVRGIKKLNKPWQYLACCRSVEKESHVQCQVTNKDGWDFNRANHESEFFPYVEAAIKTYKEKDRGKLIMAPRQPFVFSKFLWEKVGGWDEELFSYGEDDQKILAAWGVGVRLFPMVMDSKQSS